MSASSDNRPTFGTYWRNNKDVSTKKSLTFVQSDPSQPNSKVSEKTEESEQSAKNKRRTQVRKAQIQHRARKANYTKQLEADITTIRAQIEDTERARRTLRAENQSIRMQLTSDYGQQQQQQQQQQQYTTTDSGFYTAPVPTSYPQDQSPFFQQNYGFDIHGTGLERYYDVTDADMNELLSAPEAYYDDSSSPAYASSSRESSGGMYGSPQYMDSGSSTPYHALLPRTGSHSDP